MITIEVLKNENNFIWLKIKHEYYLFHNKDIICHIDRLNDVEIFNHAKHTSAIAVELSKFTSNLKRR
jgi:hypothetical protein